MVWSQWWWKAQGRRLNPKFQALQILAWRKNFLRRRRLSSVNCHHPIQSEFLRMVNSSPSSPFGCICWPAFLHQGLHSLNHNPPLFFLHPALKREFTSLMLKARFNCLFYLFKHQSSGPHMIVATRFPFCIEFACFAILFFHHLHKGMDSMLCICNG